MGRRLVRKDRYIFFLLKQPILSFWTMSSKNHQKIWPSSTLMSCDFNFWLLELVQIRFNCCVLAAVIQLSTCLVKNLSITIVLVMKSMGFLILYKLFVQQMFELIFRVIDIEWYCYVLCLAISCLSLLH